MTANNGTIQHLESFLQRRHPNIDVLDLARDTSAGHLVVMSPCFCDNPQCHALPGQLHYHRISVVGEVYGEDMPFRFWAELEGVLPDVNDRVNDEVHT